jgi:hypothetical protein
MLKRDVLYQEVINIETALFQELSYRKRRAPVQWLKSADQ